MLWGVRSFHLQSDWAPYGQTGRPRGNASVQAFVAPSLVMLIFAVALPSYVMTSRRDELTGAPLAYVTETDIARTTVPAVGYG
jgi:hypothetical protein